MYKKIAQEIRDFEGKADEISKEVQISKYAEYFHQSTVLRVNGLIKEKKIIHIITV